MSPKKTTRGASVESRRNAETGRKTVCESPPDGLHERVELQENDRIRRRVMEAFADSLSEFDDLYRELAK
jgi:hypothetical protein